MSKVLFFPVVNSEAELNDIIARSAWFLSHFEINEILVPVATECLSSVDWAVPKTMDQSISRYFDALRPKVRISTFEDTEAIAKEFDKADIVFEWDTERSDLLTPALKAKLRRANKKVWSVDPVKTRMEGSFYIEAGLHLAKDKQRLIEQNKARFRTIAEKLGSFDTAYVMATGPSVSRYGLYDYSNSLSVVCNSVILDDDLMSTVEPQFVVFADPIFHFGPSQYAANFRDALRLAARKYDFTIVVPFKYYSLLVAVEPTLRDRIVAVPFEKERPYNFNLRNEFEVKTTANILTLLMIPLAATFAEKVSILGCDGRPIEQDDYFWVHNKRTQINDKMANIKEVHPGFFAIDYNDYYLEHCSTLEHQMTVAEGMGKKFDSLGHSYIPALQARTAVGRRLGPVGHLEPSVAVIIDPDAKSWSGHYMAYNEKLAKQLETDGKAVEVLCRRDLDEAIISGRKNYQPTFTRHSWQIGNPKAAREHAVTFEKELIAGIEHVVAKYKGQILLYMYCGGVEHAEILKRVTIRFDRLIVNVNLFYLSFRLTPQYAEFWRPFLERVDSDVGLRRFIVTTPTEKVRNRLAELTGVVLPVAPHPSTGISDEQFISFARNAARISPSQELKVLFPSASRPEKGYEISLATVCLLEEETQLLPCIRHNPTFSTPERFSRINSHFTRAELIEGELSDSEFLELFLAADIVVLPYTPDAFSERTSGLLIDAIYCHLPCVVIRGTWLANIVERYGCGVAVEELTPEMLVAGVRKIADDYGVFRKNAGEAAFDYFSRNSWKQFSRFLRNGGVAALEHVEGKYIRNRPLIGPYKRNDGAHWDETSAVAELFLNEFHGSSMIDVGAHHGSALMPFLNQGWSILAFEPDRNNRQRLSERLSKHPRAQRVVLDKRCVGEVSAKGRAFFSSEQSTGISGLSAFHETHRQTQQVDVVSLSDYLSTGGAETVDFLKIDTEGHDLFVLRGFPWRRGKPAVIECEFEDSKTVPLGYTFHDLAQFLLERRYTVYVSEWHPIVRYGIRHDWRALMRYPCELADPKGWGNLLAFRENVDEECLVGAVKKVLKLGARTQAQIRGLVTSLAPSASVSIGPPNFRFEPDSHYAPIAPNQWRYTHSETKQKLWMASVSQPIGCSQAVIGGLRIEADRALTISVTLGRHGKTAFEGKTQRLQLAPGKENIISLSKKFDHSHGALKLQVEVVALPGGGTANLTITDLYMFETPDSLCRRLGDKVITLGEANRRLRSGDIGNALSMYLWLYEQHNKRMYADNARFAAKRLGMSLASLDDFL